MKWLLSQLRFEASLIQLQDSPGRGLPGGCRRPKVTANPGKAVRKGCQRGTPLAPTTMIYPVSWPLKGGALQLPGWGPWRGSSILGAGRGHR